MLKTLFEEVLESFTQQPWYINLGYIAGFLITLFIFLIVLVIMAEITKTLFVADIIAIGFIICTAIANHSVSFDTIVSIVLLLVGLLVLLFLLYCNENYYGENIGTIIFEAIFDGILNLCILSCCFLIFTIPFALKSLEKNDRYH